MAMDGLQWIRHYSCFPGQGQFDLACFMEYVLLAGYNGPLIPGNVQRRLPRGAQPTQRPGCHAVIAHRLIPMGGWRDSIRGQ